MDNFNIFIHEYLGNINDILRKTLKKNFEEADIKSVKNNMDFILALNFEELLAKKKKDGSITSDNTVFKTTNPKLASEFVNFELSKNRLLIIHQEQINSFGEELEKDHWFVAIGSIESIDTLIVKEESIKVYIIENLPICGISHRTLTLKQATDMIYNIVSGYIKDKVYGNYSKHTIKIWIYERRELTSQIIHDFI